MTVVVKQQSNTYLPHLELSPDQSQAIDFIMSYPFDAVRARLVRKQILPEGIVDQAITEYKKFLVLARLEYGPLEMFSRQVDEVWHAHILFTRDYAEFCQIAFGQFFHHQPLTHHEAQTSSEKISKQDPASHFAIAYTTVFGALSPLWENVRLSDCKTVSDCKTSLSDCKTASDCKTSLSDCKTVSDCKTSLSDCKTVSDCKTSLSDCKTASDCKTSLSDCKTASDCKTSLSDCKTASDCKTS
jgi:hypothetical protein